MNSSKRIRISQLSMALAVALSAPVMAQNTSSAIGGRITSTDGKPVAGATVSIKHNQSGSVSSAVTDAEGRYSSRGLRVGGPYTVTITKDGVTETRDNVYLQLAETKSLDASLGQKVLDSVTVTGVAAGSEVFSSDKMGTGTNISREQIDALPSATRNIQDYIRLDPRISQVSKADGAISVGGQNSRYNLIRIDGVSASDPFGLESNNLPTERQPVSMDAIEAINIGVADYDVTIAGGVGAVINAVTKSGTNDFKGNVFYSFRDKDWVRKDLNNVIFNGFESEETYGGTFGGAIIKDKLFFFANYEKYTRASPGVGLGDTPFGAGNITQADVDAVQAAASNYGFEAGDLNPAAADTTIEEYAIKLDWNINENHRAALRYSNTEQSVLRFPQLDNNSISLSSFWYALPKTFDSTVLELFSDWNDSFSTEFKVSQRNYNAIRSTFSNLPQIEIRGYPGSNSIFIGTEQNSHVNRVETEQTSFFGAANWYIGNHQIKFGTDWEKNDIVNFFGRNINGVYQFSNLAGFIAGTPSNYTVRVPLPGGSLDDIPAAYGQENLALFVQDTWAVNANLTLSYGVRWDKPSYDKQRLSNSFIEGIYGYDNTTLIDATLFQPRFGFNYTFDSERPKQIRGGVGLFQGASPNVWLAGVYQNTGLNYLEYSINNPGAIFTPDIDPPYTPSTNPACFPTPTLASCARQNVDLIEPGLALPSAWKANLAFEQELPWDGIVFSVEFLKTKVKDAIYVERLDLYNAAGEGVTRIGQDGRPLFWAPGGYTPTLGSVSAANSKFYRPIGVGDVLLLRNTDKGDSTQITFGLERPMANDWAWSFAYTFTEANEVSPLTSSINASNWNNTVIGAANENVAYDSRYAIQDRFTGTLDWQHSFFGDYKTRVGLFYEGRSGRPFSYIFANDMNGDTSSGTVLNDLFYVPAAQGDVVFTGGAAMEQAFFSWLETKPDLLKYAGQIAPANAFKTGFVHNFDVRISQELPGFYKGHKTLISLDIMNFGNLLNKKWGVIDDYGFFSTARVARYAGICSATVTALCPAGSNGKYVYNFTSADEPQVQENNNDKGNTGVSRWSILATVKYEF